MKHIICCLILLLTCGPVFAKNTLTLTPAKEDKTLRCEPKETEHGLQAMFRFTTPAGKPAGGDYQLYLDGLFLTSGQFQGTSLEKTLEIPSTTLSNGQHSLRCEVRTPSDTYTTERSFSFDASPTLALTNPLIDINGLLDATVSLRFFGTNDGTLGLLDVLIDERPVTQTKLTSKQIGTTPLSRLLDKGLAIGQLPAGTHLLTLRATGINGASTVARTPFTVGAPPELVIKRDKHNKLLEVQARFLPVEAGYPGNVEVLFDQDLLLSRRAEKGEVVITKDELVEALKKRGRVDLNGPVTLVFSLRSMNGFERWQVVEVAP